MSIHEIKHYEDRIDNLAIGIGRHLETLQGQIDDRFSQLETHYATRLSLLEGKLKMVDRKTIRLL